MQPGMDPNLLKDFLTESRELIEQLDADLVSLETTARAGGDCRDLLDQIFRALHTVKGAASFLGLEHLIRFSHAAEDALNRLRKGEVQVRAMVMDALLRSVDTLRTMIDQLAEGQEPSAAPQDLIELLQTIGSGHNTAADAPAGQTTGPVESASAGVQTGAVELAGDESPCSQVTVGPLNLPSQKAEILPFMAEDLQQQAQRLQAAAEQAQHPAQRGQAAATIGEVASELIKTAEFFELDDLSILAQLLDQVAGHLSELSQAMVDQLLPRLRAIACLMDQQRQALTQNQVIHWPLQTLKERIEKLLAGQTLESDLRGTPDPWATLALDGIAFAGQPGLAAAPATEKADGAPTRTSPLCPSEKSADTTKAADTVRGGPGVEQTIRVEVTRLEALLNLVGQLVLSKNRFLALSRKVRERKLPLDIVEELAGASGELDRLTAELQVGIMRTRMQPLTKLFDRYPRVIRDMARLLNKEIRLEITGRETEVDKSVLELLADPLVHILRNAADHGIEPPQVRQAVGKPRTGLIRLTAQHQGSHVRVEVEDDGKGLDRDLLARKAVEKGLAMPEQIAAMSDEEVYRFIFAAGFSTAEKVTDLSGRGVGMDVVRTNIAKLNGQVRVSSAKGKGTKIEILIPLTVAIMPAMIVGVGRQLYSIPLQSIEEIVKPEAHQVHSVRGHTMMRLRDCVLPLVDLRKRLGEPAMGPARFAVVVGVGTERAGLLVDRLVGQQEIVIKPLDDTHSAGGPFSGATIREDGDVCLILDVIQLVRQNQILEAQAA